MKWLITKLNTLQIFCLWKMIILYPLCSWWFAYLTVDGVTCWFEETVDLKKLDVFIIYTFPMGIIVDKPFKMMDIAYFVVTMKIMWWNDKSQNLTHLQIFCLCPMIILYPLWSWWFAYLTVRWCYLLFWRNEIHLLYIRSPGELLFINHLRWWILYIS